ncbi:hypothetical protein [Bacillus salipaludis]|uniref:Uncharacterized protein n=1 Tax=Bacillus salipaludis TaxID=2547811 RepID=A0AA90R328_9BACI|nr:hypothetical protein [Bacillus salipaludis]MDQ6598460.1 hypothetical protein [Bacillus salipaludis]
MDNNDKVQDHIQQPLMSTGTTEPGFERDTNKSKQETKPKIGETIVGDKE